MSEATRTLLGQLIRLAKGMLTACEQWLNAQPERNGLGQLTDNQIQPGTPQVTPQGRTRPASSEPTNIRGG